MRWKKKSPPIVGEVRIKTKFLLFPKTIKNESRWLEKATYKQQYECFETVKYKIYYWEDIEWID